RQDPGPKASDKRRDDNRRIVGDKRQPRDKLRVDQPAQCRGDADDDDGHAMSRHRLATQLSKPVEELMLFERGRKRHRRIPRTQHYAEFGSLVLFPTTPLLAAVSSD